jgi:TIR domain
VKNTSFSHMTRLLKLNLEKNSIGNWYERLFDQNQRLDILNLRANKLTLLTNDMKEDLASVKYLAMGNNDFECSCVLQEFMHKLFSATENADVVSLRFDNEISYDEFEKEFFERIEDSTRATLGVRNYIRPEYDVISRTYQKYNEMAEKSVEALKSRVIAAPKPKSLVLKSKAGNESSEPTTVLFDYDEKDYKCMNASEKRQRPIIELSDLCDESLDDGDDESPYTRRKNHSLLTLWVSIPLVISLSALLLLLYWKWWYIKYFFVLCKNSAILTFMDDTEGGKDRIIKTQSGDSIETFLYDVFVSYSEQNREWVLEEFIPNVEQRESINVCLHERDFQVGYGILENIVSCMDRSRCLLLLVSENFLLSQWCQFEMNLAQHRLLETRREKLILVLLEDIPTRKQPKTLKYLMRTKTYIKWPQNGGKEERQVFWKRLKKAIISSQWDSASYGSIV